MTDGQTLKAFIEGQPINRTRIAKDLKMTRQNLYNLYESVKLTDDTKQKFEGYFGKKIFDKATSETKKQAEIALPEPDENNIALITARNYEKLINTNSELAKAVLEQRKITTEVERKILEISAGTDLLQVLILNYHEFWIDQQGLPNGESLKRNLRKKVPLLLQKIKEADIVH